MDRDKSSVGVTNDQINSSGDGENVATVESGAGKKPRCPGAVKCGSKFSVVRCIMGRSFLIIQV